MSPRSFLSKALLLALPPLSLAVLELLSRGLYQGVIPPGDLGLLRLLTFAQLFLMMLIGLAPYVIARELRSKTKLVAALCIGHALFVVLSSVLIPLLLSPSSDEGWRAILLASWLSIACHWISVVLVCVAAVRRHGGRYVAMSIVATVIGVVLFTFSITGMTILTIGLILLAVGWTALLLSVILPRESMASQPS